MQIQRRTVAALMSDEAAERPELRLYYLQGNDAIPCPTSISDGFVSRPSSPFRAKQAREKAPALIIGAIAVF